MAERDVVEEIRSRYGFGIQYGLHRLPLNAADKIERLRAVISGCPVCSELERYRALRQSGNKEG